MANPLERISSEAREQLRKRKQPSWADPMLARLTHTHFSDAGWIFERKLDGERALAFHDGHRARLMSRNGKSLNGSYPEIVEALGKTLDTPSILDGEIVAFDGKVTSFSRLQNRMHVKDPDEARATGVAVYYYVFDILYWDEYDTTQLPLRQRKAFLQEALEYGDPIRYTRHRNEQGERYLEDACKRGWEGLIAKKADSAYAHGRSSHWLKFKCVNQQEFVIGGYTDPEGERIGFGALLIGYYENGHLVYAGKVGTGVDDDTLRDLRDRMDRHERRSPPFDTGALPEKGVHWITPALVCEVGFTEWTRRNQLRHPRYLGLRRDKEPKEVVRES